MATTDAVCVARIVYFAVKTITVCVFLYFPCEMRQNVIEKFNYLYFCSFILILIGSAYLFCTSGNNPGFLGEARMKSLKHALSTTNITPVNERELESFPQGGVQENLLRAKPDKHYCEECQMWQPYRTKHCPYCKKCVHKFDHHCYWIGSCVGELNHRRFWLFLLVQTLFNFWSLNIGRSGIYMAQEPRIEESDGKVETSGKSTVIFLFLSFVAFVFFIFTVKFFKPSMWT
eukprot:TRINITY_DN3268_c0_g1_i4.p1 TRINITY_DN3268_c0_g1~~TRINITY_DN3268_c0_g1_i4.p1  ORF type:complete len:231 (+),score=12.68 TRINITY_DN3268_c0_g1_i4:173-865(+)